MMSRILWFMILEQRMTFNIDGATYLLHIKGSVDDTHDTISYTNCEVSVRILANLIVLKIKAKAASLTY